jgi:phage shock protein E
MAVRLILNHPMTIAAKINPTELQQLFENSSPPVLLNVLTPEAFAESRIPGSINACVYMVAFGDQVAESIPDKATPIVFYGQSDETSEADLAASRLAALGYTHLTCLSGGLDAWQKAGLPIEEGAPTTTPAAVSSPST